MCNLADKFWGREFWFLAGLMLSSCATPYRPLAHQYGYFEQQVSEDVFEISFLGNGASSYDRVFDFALLRAAEIALARQATSFAVLDVHNLSSARRYQSPSEPSYYRTTSAYLSTEGNLVPSAPEFPNGTEWSYLVETQPQERVFYRPGVKLKVKLSTGPAARNAYDPATLIVRLKHKYGLQP
jgi:hypothetical protein